MLPNPYLDEFNQIKDNWNQFIVRDSLVKKYSWAIPNQEAIDYLVSLSPIVEMGAGTGYWAYLITQAGGDIIAFDKQPHYNLQATPFSRRMEANNQWTEVLQGECTRLKSTLVRYPDRTLFLCWAPYNDNFAYRCLKTYKGNKLVVVGEGWGGCTANDKFFSLLDKEWEVDKEIEIPQYSGIHDYLVGYVRK
jgi:hypothetical protein